jgi:hypothetical protein
MENKLPTALEVFTKWGNKPYHFKITDVMIDFAKLHVTRALEEASKNAHIINNYLQGGCMSPDDYEIDKESILNSYPLDNIK